MSSPKMNNIIVAGCIFIYSTVFVMRIHVDSSNTTRQVICIVSVLYIINSKFSMKA